MSNSIDLARRLADDIDPKLLAFIRQRVNSFTKWDLVRFFHENPHTMDTAENIARYIGRDVHVIDSDLLELVEAGVLRVSQISEQTVYALGTDQAVRALLDQFILACEDRDFRVRVIYQVIRGMQ